MKKMTIEEKKEVKEFFEALFEGTEGLSKYAPLTAKKR